MQYKREGRRYITFWTLMDTLAFMYIVFLPLKWPYLSLKRAQHRPKLQCIVIELINSVFKLLKVLSFLVELKVHRSVSPFPFFFICFSPFLIL